MVLGQAGVVAASISGPSHTACSRSEDLGHRSGGDWEIGHAGKSEEAQKIDSQRSFIPDRITMGAMKTGVKHYKRAARYFR
jgi:hypothetical protein